jgi:hypothetical protein
VIAAKTCILHFARRHSYCLYFSSELREFTKYETVFCRCGRIH